MVETHTLELLKLLARLDVGHERLLVEGRDEPRAVAREGRLAARVDRLVRLVLLEAVARKKEAESACCSPSARSRCSSAESTGVLVAGNVCRLAPSQRAVAELDEEANEGCTAPQAMVAERRLELELGWRRGAAWRRRRAAGRRELEGGG